MVDAGLVPRRSGCARSTWGLNDEEIAHEGLSVERLERADPAVALTHEYPVPRFGQPDRGLGEMIDTVHAYMARVDATSRSLSGAGGSIPSSYPYLAGSTRSRGSPMQSAEP